MRVYFGVVLLFVLAACDVSVSVELDEEQPNSVEEQVQNEVAKQPEDSGFDYTTDEEMQELYDTGAEEVQVLINGVVIKNLADDNEGSRHQKFLVELNSGQTLLVSHNIDLAPRINTLEEGHEVDVFGQYEWNDRGGVIHWTHHDPDGDHIGGWIKHNGEIYE